MVSETSGSFFGGEAGGVTTAAGVDVEPECDGEVDHSGHDHGRRLAACPKHSESDGASKPAVALALAALAGGLALFL